MKASKNQEQLMTVFVGDDDDEDEGDDNDYDNGSNKITAEPLHNDHFGDGRKWSLC